MPPPPPFRTARDRFPSCSSSLHERPSRDAAALTTAFTIRTGSRQTIHATFFPARECRSGERPGAAPASISAADISACLPESVGRGSLVTEDLREVSPLSRSGDVILHRKAGRQLRLGRPPFVGTHPLSDPLQVGFRFLPHPFPAASSASFAVGLPSRGGDGVTSFISSITPG